jgi:glycosidase
LEWLKEYADGLRLLVSDLNGSYNETIKNLVDNVNKISKEAFKPKFVAVYPFTENHGQTKLIDQSLLNINSEVVSNPSELIKLFKNLYTDSHPNPAFELGDFRSQRLSEKIKDNSLLNLYHSIALLLKGTPIILYGDEIELNQNDEFMKWNNEINCGFSSSNLSKQSNCDNNVRKKLARGETLPRIYKKLSALRQEPSFSWGDISFPDHRQQSNLVSFVRKAAGFDGYLVVANTGKSESAVDFRSLFKDLSSQATVEYFYSNNNNFKNDFKFNDTLQLNNIYLKQGELLVAKFSN